MKLHPVTLHLLVITTCRTILKPKDIPTDILEQIYMYDVTKNATVHAPLTVHTININLPDTVIDTDYIPVCYIAEIAAKYRGIHHAKLDISSYLIHISERLLT